MWLGVVWGRVEGSVLWLILHNDYKIGLSFKKIYIQWNISLYSIKLTIIYVFFPSGAWNRGILVNNIDS